MCSLIKFIPEGELKPFAIAISDDMKCREIDGFDQMSDITKYRLYYKLDKSHIANWKQNKPNWYDKTTEEIINLEKVKP